MKVIRNLIARLLRLSAMPASAAAASPQVPPRRMPTPAARAWAFASVPRSAHPAQATDDASDGASALCVAMLMASCSEEGVSADVGSFGLCGTPTISD